MILLATETSFDSVERNHTMGDEEFFESPTEQSVVKSTIVSKYFWSWANIVIPSAKRYNKPIQYIDLYAGPGRYEDDTQSTPLMIIKKAIEDEKMRGLLKMIFNDGNPNFAASLRENIAKIEGIERLRYQPEIFNEEVDEKFIRMFSRTDLPPTLTFLDPFGYMGLSRGLVNAVLKDWGCDCIFFFNYNRINMGINNPFVENHMNALFGQARADGLREKLRSMNPTERELTIVEAIAQTLKEIGGRYVLPFCFKNERGVRTSHHLIFVSKHPRGYMVMKDIMASVSSDNDQGVPSFTYCPPTNVLEQMLLFSLSRPLDMLEDMLLADYAGKTLTMEQLYDEHNIDKRYIRRNYVEVLLKLERDGVIIVQPSKRKTGSMGDKVLITFPKKEV
jgi:three-Cys-motif partner protein